MTCVAWVHNLIVQSDDWARGRKYQLSRHLTLALSHSSNFAFSRTFARISAIFRAKELMDFERGFSLVELLLFLVLGVVLVWIGTLEFRLMRLTRTLRLLFTGRTGADLEGVLREYMERMDRTDETIKAFNERATAIERKAPFNLSHLGVVRFNPFADKGGDQSFTVAILDDHGDGVVFTGLHSR